MKNLNIDLAKLISLTSLPTKMQSFASIRNYHSETNDEVAHHRVNLNFDYANAKAKDKEFILNFDVQGNYKQFLTDFSIALDNHIKYLKKNNASDVTIAHFNKLYSKINFENYEKAFAKAYDSFIEEGKPTYFGTPKKAFNRVNPFTFVNDTIKYHSEKDRLYITAQKLKNGKTILVKGSVNETKNNVVTFARKVIEKDMNKHNYRMFSFDRIEVINALKQSFKGDLIL